MPYALTTGAAALILGTLPVGFGMPWWSALILGASLLLVFLMWFGKTAEVDSKWKSHPVLSTS
jgi:hypothetical protein